MPSNSILDGVGSSGVTDSSTTVKMPTMQQPTNVGPKPGHLIEPELAPHYYSWKAEPNNKQKLDTLLTHADPIITKSLRAYGRGSYDSPTLYSKAKLMFVKGLQSYDPSKAKLNTFMLSYMKGLNRASVKEDRIISLPEQLLLEANRLREEEERFEDQYDRPPNDVELADRMNLSRKRIAQIRSVKSKTPISIGAASEDEDEGDRTFDPVVSEESFARKHWREAVYLDEDDTNKLIMEHTLGMHNKPVLSNQEIAKLLNMSPSAVSQRKAKLQQKLESIYEIE